MKGALIITSLITIALTARSEYFISSSFVWFGAFLPVICMYKLHSIGRSYTNQIYALTIAIAHYIAYHHIFISRIAQDGFDFWPLSPLSLTMIIILVYRDFTNGNFHDKSGRESSA